MDLIPKPDQVVAAAANVAHKVLYGGLADLRPMPRTLIADGVLREVYHYRPRARARELGDPVLLVTPLAAPATCFDLRFEIVPGGHRGMLTGRAARRTTWRVVDEWIDSHSSARAEEPNRRYGSASSRTLARR